MLIISRKRNEKLIIADDIEITILEVGRNRVRFGVKAPQHIRIQTHLKTDAVKVEQPSEGPAEQPAPVEPLSMMVGSTKNVTSEGTKAHNLPVQRVRRP
jgi:carbon storage regulator